MRHPLSSIHGFRRVTALGCALVTLPLVSTPVLAQTDSPPTAVVRDLYREAMVHSGFTLESIQGARPWLAPHLYRALLKKVNEPVPKGDAPDIDGDVFLDAQDLPTHVEVGSATIAGPRARVGVVLDFSGEKHRCTVFLDRLEDGWKISDIDFGKDGKLTDLL